MKEISFEEILRCMLILTFWIFGFTFSAAATPGIITTVAGDGAYRFSGDGGPAINRSLANPSGVFADGSGNLYIVDNANNRIRKVDVSGTITSVAGNGIGGFSGDGGPATSSSLYSPRGVFVDGSGNLYIADWLNHRIRKVDAETGTITTVAGTGIGGFSGDGGPATLASLDSPFRVFVDRAGNLYIADAGNHRIRKVDAETGIITSVAGNGERGFSGDGGPATSSRLDQPLGMFVDRAGNVYIADAGNHRIRKVDAETGTITTVAGTGIGGFSGDGGPATRARLSDIWDVSVDGAGSLFIADTRNNRIRKVDASGIITTVVGDGFKDDRGLGRFSGDGGSATRASLSWPFGIFVDGSGSLYIADSGNQRIRKVEGIAAPTTVQTPIVKSTLKHRTVVIATVIRDGIPAAELEVAFSRSVSDQPSDYKWSDTTDVTGRVEIEITADHHGQFWRIGATGYYLARATDPMDKIVGQWGSIPINGGREITLSLPIGAPARIEGESSLEASAPFTLNPNSPNPFNPSTQIAYQLLEPGEVSLVIYNLLGQQVRVLVQGHQERGFYQVTWDGKDALGRPGSSGIYFYRLISKESTQTRQMLLLK